MCGRFAVTLPDDAMARLFAARPANDLPPVPNYNVCPTMPVHAVSLGEGGRHLGAMRWGFVPHWYDTPDDGPLLINARAETIAEKPAFRSACRNRRCLIPAAGFYEWSRGADGTKLPWFVRAADGAPLVFAGVWQVWERGDQRIASCAIVTTESSPDVAHIHHRMPVIVAPEHWGFWLGEEGRGAARLMHPAPEGAVTAHRVSRAVNSNRAQGPELIEPLEDGE
ncbi:SOS response-associated peptidase [Roseovarius salinarum]|uniref:SOS response-associated peptidase n=1 Tax=Roseovarius salinarum TaxID=1981892 RepID=UPI000C34CB32|nr:SOS response-associated peptidase [Roseovarius salinarum]